MERFLGFFHHLEKLDPDGNLSPKAFKGSRLSLDRSSRTKFILQQFVNATRVALIHDSLYRTGSSSRGSNDDTSDLDEENESDFKDDDEQDGPDHRIPFYDDDFIHDEDSCQDIISPFDVNHC